MAIVFQLPKTYLRGAIANQTMRNLTHDQKIFLNKKLRELCNISELRPCKGKFISSLANTIRCDYASDKTTAEQEYLIALWRALVYLYYDASYNYICEACNQTNYVCERGTRVTFDRNYPICPNCNKIKIVKDDIITYIDNDYYLDCLNNNYHNVPRAISPIKVIKGAEKVKDPDELMADPSQISKFFTMFINNYLKQIIKENAISTHGKINKIHTGPCDRLLVEAIISILKKYKIHHHYNDESRHFKYYTIFCQTTLIPQKIVSEIASIIQTARTKANICLLDKSDRILIPNMGANATIIELNVFNNETVLVATPIESDGETLEAVNTISEEDVYKYCPVEDYEMSEMLNHVHQSLPCDLSKKVFALMTGTGEIFKDFQAKYPDGINNNTSIPRQNKMAEYLGITPKDLKHHISCIKTRYLATV